MLIKIKRIYKVWTWRHIIGVRVRVNSHVENCRMAQLFPRSNSKFSQTQRILKTKKDKAISMMRGKSPRSDVEVSIKLNFVAAILDFCRPSWLTKNSKDPRYSTERSRTHDILFADPWGRGPHFGNHCPIPHFMLMLPCKSIQFLIHSKFWFEGGSMSII